MKRILAVSTMVLLLAGVSTAAVTFLKGDGTHQDPANNGAYTGNVGHTINGEDEIITITTTDPAGVLTVREEDCDPGEWEALKNAAPGTAEAQVVVHNGTVQAVIIP
jgi:hypothetical protein